MKLNNKIINFKLTKLKIYEVKMLYLLIFINIYESKK